MNKPMNVMSGRTRDLAGLLATAQVGETITYQQMRDVIGVDPQNGARHVLASARRVVLRENGSVFDVVANVGIVRLGNDGIVDSSQSDVRRIRKAATRGLRKVGAADIGSLSNDKRITAVATAAVLQLAADSASKRGVDRLKSLAQATPDMRRIAAAQALEALKK
jgi:hypothetical protein